MSKLNKLKELIIQKIDKLVISYLTVERGRRRKYIWKTKVFKEAFFIHTPKVIFIGFVVIMCWKINNRIKELNGDRYRPYEAKSDRELEVEKQNEDIHQILNLENEFDPSRSNPSIGVEYKELNKYRSDDLTEKEMLDLERFEEWASNSKNRRV